MTSQPIRLLSSKILESERVLAGLSQSDRHLETWGMLTRPIHRYGYHVPRTKLRDAYYKKLEEEKAAKAGS